MTDPDTQTDDEWNDPPGVSETSERTRRSYASTAPVVGLVGAFWLMGHTIALLLANETWAALVASLALAAYIVAWQIARPASGWESSNVDRRGGDE